MTQGVGSNVSLDSSLFPIIFNNFPKALASHGLAVAVGKQQIALLAFQQLAPGLFQIGGQGL